MWSSPLSKDCQSLKIKRVYSQYGASTVFKPHQTLRQLLVIPKDKASDEEKSGVVYRYPCKGCDKVYIGQTKRSLGDRIKEHCAKTTSNQSALAEHSKNTGHELDTGNVTVLCWEDKLIPRKVREAIFIKKELKPTLNRDGAVNFQRFMILYGQHLTHLAAMQGCLF